MGLTHQSGNSRKARVQSQPACRPVVEPMESRVLLSVTPARVILFGPGINTFTVNGNDGSAKQPIVVSYTGKAHVTVTVFDFGTTITSVQIWQEVNFFSGLQTAPSNMDYKLTDCVNQGNGVWTGTIKNFKGTPPDTAILYASVTDINGQVGVAQVNMHVTLPPPKISWVEMNLNSVPNNIYPAGAIYPGGVTPEVEMLASDQSGSIAKAHLYMETNGIPGLQTGQGGDKALPDMTSGPLFYFESINVSPLKPGTYTLYAVADDGNFGVSAPTAVSFTVVAGAPSQLTFIQQPVNTVAGALMSPPVTVAIEDLFGNIVLTDNSTVTLGITDLATGILVGSQTSQAVNGIASFTFAESNQSTYILTADENQTLLPAVSATFTEGPFGTRTTNTLTVMGTGANDNILVTTDGQGNFVVNENNFPQEVFSMAGVTSLIVNGGLGDDVITIDPSVKVATTVNGGPGNDTIFGGGGFNYLIGGAGNDEIHGGPGSNVLWGGFGNDTLFGGAFRNLIEGRAGDDLIYSMIGAVDTVYGGLGNDTVHALGTDNYPNNDVESILLT